MRAFLLLFVFCLVVSTDNRPRTFEVYGNHYEIGKQLGEKTKDQIRALFAEDLVLNQKLIPFYHTERGQEVFNHFYKVNVKSTEWYHLQNDRFPDYMDELKGIAAGAGVEFYKVFMSTLNEEFRDYVGEVYAYEPKESCSDVIINDGASYGICHNEDGSLLDFDRTSVVTFYLGKNTPTERFTAYCYAGQLPTAAFGFNQHIAFTMNYLHTKKGDYDGIARNFIARHLLSASSFDDAVERITSIPHCVGHNYQIMDLADGRLIDLEVAPFFRIGSVKPLPGRPHFHSNMYSLLMVDDTPSESSIHREKRYKEMKVPTTFAEALGVLSDEEDPIEPIYRNTTLNTAVFDYYERECRIYSGRASKENVILRYQLFRVC